MTALAPIYGDNAVFARWRAAALPEWSAYVDHAFVRGLADGSLPEDAFRYYLQQDYLFLIQFARAYALAAYKADTLEDMRAAAATVAALLDTEMRLHVEFCAGWGLSETQMATLPEDPSCVAYTRYVLDKGMAGDVLDLYAALVPCVVGYGEIGARLAADPGTVMNGNAYAPWIEMYSGEEYQEVARGAIAQLDRLYEARGGERRDPGLLATFTAATRLEVGFWQMGLNAAGAPK